MKGTISFTDDQFVIATQLVEPSYLSLDSALLFNGIIQQVPRSIECVTSQNSFRRPKIGAVFHKIPSNLFFGYKRQIKGSSYIFVAESEKAVIDGVYLNRYFKKDLKELMPKLNRQKLIEFAERFEGRGSQKIRSMVND
ncbi:MAG: hypothetical protein KGH61_04020 [Candidatus Micrarchaeota archaeon]|nr:hypothetical protein [Candidatus Micrarchaeota archaeon]MDE1848087.1 hypothetical protein [Candidatus Micrarchaeota archaeon]MDE1864936.1 hypothetical protein [Candidatus Micrarchaeota archaeon]